MVVWLESRATPLVAPCRTRRKKCNAFQGNNSQLVVMEALME